jgi:amidase
MSAEICFATATELAAALRARRLSCVEVMAAHLAQIERLNPLVNAIVTLLPEQAMAAAYACDQALADGSAPDTDQAPLFGLPVAHKDLVETRGIRTTFGSPIFANHVPERDALLVERLRAAGAITIGKTNTPEFGAGSQTFNPVFGPTRNPYDLSKTCGGSSGGAAVALACGMLPIADGSDLGGSLRNPASFCNLVGFRTTPGRVPIWPDPTPFLPMLVEGPMARTVTDVALMLSALAGPDPRAPLSLEAPGAHFRQPLVRDLRSLRLAWSPDLGGLPVDQRVAEVFASRRASFTDLGCAVEDASPDMSGADEVFSTLRALRYELSLGSLLDTHRDQLKDTVIWNIEAGRRLTGPQVGRAISLHAALLERMRAFFARYDALILPTAQVPPFPVEQPYIQTINGVPMESYMAWMRSCAWITVTGQPALAVPAGFTADGLPVGLQIVGRPRDDFAVLQLGYAYEQTSDVHTRRPAIVSRA